MSGNVFLSDAAIVRPEDDRLGRSAFAKRLAEAILNWEQEDSIVIALFGPWGSGKTSVINMALAALEAAAEHAKQENAPIIVRFNPWHFTDQGQLLDLFLVELLSSIQNGAPEHFEKLKPKLAALGEFLSPITEAPIIGDYLKPVAGLAKVMSKKEGLAELRKQADQAFRELGRRVVIVMDDIDRLTQPQIRQLFQIIKLNADFPSTVYLIAADRSVVERSLDLEQGGLGRGYLEKIVQAGFDLPLPDPSHVSQVLIEQLSAARVPVDSKRFVNLYHSGFRALFTSLRDVKRFASALQFTFSMVVNEVDAVDFVAVEALRVFAPEAYREVGRNKDLFVSPSDSTFRGGQASEDRKQAISAVLAQAGEKQGVAVRICFFLFPQVKGLSNNAGYGYEWQRTWRKERRVCADEVFDTYFLLSTRAGDVSRTEVLTTLAAATEPDRLRILLADYISQGRYPRFLALLPDELDSLEISAVKTLCSELFAVSEQQLPRRLAVDDVDMDYLTSLAVYRALMRVSEDERYDWFVAEIEAGQSLSMVVNQLQNDPADTTQLSKSLFPTERALAARRLAAGKLEELAQSGELVRVKHFPSILWHWSELSDRKDILEQFLERCLSTPAYTLDLLWAFLGITRSWSEGDFAATSTWKIDVKGLGLLVPVERVEAMLDTLEADVIDGLSEDQRLALDVWCQSRKAHANRPEQEFNEHND